MIRKFFSVVIIGTISFLAGSYYTMNNPSTKLYDWNKNSVELFASTPSTINSAFKDIKIILTTSIDIIDNKLDNILADKNNSQNIEKNQHDHDNPSIDDLKQIDIDHEDKEKMPEDNGNRI